MTWAAVAAAGAVVVGSVIQSNSAKKAANKQQAASQAQLDWLKQNYGDAQGNFNPYMDYGKGALGGLNALMGGDYSGFMNSPDFKARVQFANEQFDNGAAAKFRLFSGGAQNDRDQLNQNLAAQGLTDYRNFLMGGAQMGQNAAAQLGSIGNGTGAQMGQAYGAMGTAGANGAISQGNAWASGLQGLSSAFGNYMGSRNATSASVYGGGSNASNFGLPAPGSGSTPNYASGGPGTFWGYS